MVPIQARANAVAHQLGWGRFRSTASITVHANVRLRRIYFSDSGKLPPRQHSVADRFDHRHQRVVVDAKPISVERPELALFRGTVPGPD